MRPRPLTQRSTRRLKPAGGGSVHSIAHIRTYQQNTRDRKEREKRGRKGSYLDAAAASNSSLNVLLAISNPVSGSSWANPRERALEGSNPPGQWAVMARTWPQGARAKANGQSVVSFLILGTRRSTHLRIPLVLDELLLILPSDLDERLDDLARGGSDSRQVDGARVGGELGGGDGRGEDDVVNDL